MKSLILRIASRFTAFDPDLLEWSKEQEQESLRVTREVRKNHAIEEYLIERARNARPNI